MGLAQCFARFFAVFWVLSALAWTPVSASTVTTDHVTAQLLPESPAIEPGQTAWVMLHFKIKDGWHTYWKNPGDSGQPPDIRWTVPEGVTVGDIEWPYPEPLPYGPLLNYGYSNDAYHLIPIKLSESWRKGEPVELSAKANWLVCADICVPEGGSFDLTLPTGDAPRQNRIDSALLFKTARALLPQEVDWTASYARDGETVFLTVTGDEIAAKTIEKADFFPYEWGLIEPSAKQKRGGTPDGLSLAMTAGPTADVGALDGVLVLTEAGDGGPVVRAVKIAATPGDAPDMAAFGATGAPAAGLGGGDGIGLASVGFLTALLFAALGGIILNLMPCVFPVLSMKAMALIRHAEKDSRTVRLHGLAYALGVLTCFAILAFVLIGLKASGATIGWGFQLQSPIFVAAMAYLFFLLGLNLSGMFEIGGSAMGIGGSLAGRSGYSGSYFTGVLAAVVSTPCTAPFMGVALGYALTQPAALSFTIFLALGVGFALPYLLLTFIPALVRLLPKPGPWMERTRQFLAFPLYASVAWLIWVLAIQTGPDGVFAALGGMVLIAFAVWLWRAVRDGGTGGRTVGRTLSAASVAGALALILGLGITSTGAPTTQLTATGQTASGPVYETFSREKLATLRAAGKPVFINMTAAWCITCHVNDRVALSSKTIADRFDDLGIAYLKGDWTNGDPEITELLESFGRSGVPLYVLYGAGDAEPMLLPQLLTETIVLNALDTISAERPVTAELNRSSQ